MSLITARIKRLRELSTSYETAGDAITRELLREAADTIEMLSEKAKTTGWIPCSERLPEEREWIGTKQFGTTISDEVYVTFETPDGERFTKHISFQNGGLSQKDQELMRVWFKGAVPIAWMPLPAPFEPQESEEV